MNRKKDTILKKITLLNKTILDSMTEKDNNAIVKNFTDDAIEILEADFGFAWWKFSDKDEYKLAYKSPSTPYSPFLPRDRANHYTAIKNKKPLFQSDIKKEDYKSSDITPYMKSFVIIPIHHEKNIYGSLTLCYKKRHNFTKEELTLAQAIGHTTAQAITIHKLYKIDALLREERSKTEFIANATHELRTPLAIMKGNVDLALTDKKNLKLSQKALQKVDEEINNLSNIIKNLYLITSPGQNVERVINPITVNITDLIHKLVKRLKVMAVEKNIQIKFNKEEANLFITGNEEYLTELFLNIIKNSITYGKNNGKTFIDISAEKNKVKIKIADNGIGISKEDLPKIFDRFYKGDKAHSNVSYKNNSGLGLAIAKWAAEIHGGTIQVKSTLGKGSVFSVVLPVSKS